MPRNIVKKYVKDNLPKISPGGLIIDVGAGEDPNYYRNLFPNNHYHKLDAIQNKDFSIDHIEDIYDLPKCLLEQYEVVLCLETLEHVPDPFAAVKACASLAKPGGLVILSSVTCWAIHRHPKDYWRFLPDAFDLLIEKSGLKKLEVKLEQVDASTQGGIFAKAIKASN